MLSDNVYIVAGSGNGLGKATAIELGRHGATVVANDLGVDVSGKDSSSEPARETVTAVENVGGTATAHYGDVSSFKYTEKLVQDTYNSYGRIDGVVNFAGILRDSISYKMTEDEWDSVIKVHLRGQFSLLRNTAAHWRDVAQTGELTPQRSFLCVTSRAALGSVGQANYSAAKAGILGLTRTTARELYQHNIRVNALMPTAFTRMIEDVPAKKRSFTREEMPPEKIAPVVGYLLSSEAEEITGCTIRAAGDAVGIVSNPTLDRVGYAKDGWTLEALAERFKDIAAGIDLAKTEREF